MPNTVTAQPSGTFSYDAFSTMDILFDAYRAHVQGRTLPAAVDVSFSWYRKEISVLPDGGAGLQQLAGVLTWARTLTRVTADWWRTGGDQLHVTTYGRTDSGTRIKVYGGGPFAECQGLVPLELDQSEPISLEQLATLLERLYGTDDRSAVA